MKIQYVRQQHECGCAVACMAMVTGLPYDKIEKQFVANFGREGVAPEVTRNFICDHGFSAVEVIAHGYHDIRQSNARMRRPFADVHVVSVLPQPDAEMNHAVVMDRRGRVYDPAMPKVRDLGEYYFICRVQGFYDERKRK
jgi:hypothetical protein